MSYFRKSNIKTSFCLSVTVRDRDVIIKAEDKIEKDDTVSTFSFYKRCTLPENTDFGALKCTMEDQKLTITAPLNADSKQNYRQIPIENVKSK